MILINKDTFLCHGLRRKKVSAWMPRTVGVLLAHQGVGHLTEGFLTLHNLMGDAGKNKLQKRKRKRKRDQDQSDQVMQGNYILYAIK